MSRWFSTVTQEIRAPARFILLTVTEPLATLVPVLAPMGRPKPLLVTGPSVSPVLVFITLDVLSVVNVDIYRYIGLVFMGLLRADLSFSVVTALTNITRRSATGVFVSFFL